MRHLLSSEMKLQRENEKMTSYNTSLMLFLFSRSPLFSHFLFPSPLYCLHAPHLGVKTHLCFRGNDFLIKVR